MEELRLGWYQERKIFIYREDCGDDKQIQLTIRLRFEGPKGVAMRPFETFLYMSDTPPHDASKCL